MLRIRLLRTGKKNAPSFRIVLTEKTAPPQGRFLEVLGFYNPRSKEIGLKKERILHWLSKGAKPSDTVHNLLVSQGIIQGPKIKKKIKSKGKAEEAAKKTEEKKQEEKIKEETTKGETDGKTEALKEKETNNELDKSLEESKMENVSS